MAITWRPATRIDLEPGLLIQPKSRGDALVDADVAVDNWRRLLRYPFASATVLEASPAIGGHHIIGFGASVVVAPPFAEAELANPRPDINSRIIASIHSRRPVLATRSEVARANAGVGVDVVVLCGAWRDEVLDPAERQDVQALLASSFTERHAGYRIRRIIHETVDEIAREFTERSVVFKAVAEFPEYERVLYSMTRESAKAVPGSLGNVLFTFREPVLRFRDSDQQMLLAALGGATDQELAAELGVTFAAVKARWRSTFARIAEAMPDLVRGIADEHRGSQKRHRVLAYVRIHPEELRPFDWKGRSDLKNR